MRTTRRWISASAPRRPTAHPDGAYGEPPSVIIRQTQAPPTQLPAQEAVLFDQVGERLPLSALRQPVSTISNIRRAEGSITSGSLYHGRSFGASNTSAELWDTSPMFYPGELRAYWIVPSLNRRE